ncbi:MAG TPA: carbon-nitrogen hydrolase family protein [Gammaproteobacteria bacterium]
MSETRARAPRVRVLACQLAIPQVDSAESRDAHLSKTAEKIARALDAQPADLVVLPELSSMSYSRHAFDRLGELAETPDGPSAEVFGALAARYRTHVAFGIARAGKKRVYISHVVMGPDGRRVGFYDKLHMAQFGASMEKDYFSPGEHLLIFKVGSVTVSIVICYDFRFPDLAATLCRDHGVRLVIHPVAFWRDGSFPSWHHLAIARAVENQVYFLSLNRAGETYGESVWCPPWVGDGLEPERFGTEEAFRHFIVDNGVIERIRNEYPFAKDRLADYRGLGANGAGG